MIQSPGRIEDGVYLDYILAMRNLLELKKSKTTAKYELEYDELKRNGYTKTSYKASLRPIFPSLTVSDILLENKIMT